MDEMKDPITLDFTATQAPAEDAPVGQKALDSERPPVRVVLLALDQGKFDSQRSLDELAALAEANGMQAVATVCQKRSTPEAATLLGEGKVEEARLVCLNTDAEAAIFDGELTRQPDPQPERGFAGGSAGPHDADFGNLPCARHHQRGQAAN